MTTVADHLPPYIIKETIMEKKEMFIKFLKKHRALRKFKNNLKRDTGVVGMFDAYTYNTPYGSFIMSAFKWRLTPELAPFWIDLDGKWQEHIK